DIINEAEEVNVAKTDENFKEAEEVNVDESDENLEDEDVNVAEANDVINETDDVINEGDNVRETVYEDESSEDFDYSPSYLSEDD
ncbi:hypothetical protein A2U01_0052271, partial [Trifolium medium]|nr:hypothetical protein [Trifolium medium]